MAELSTIGGTVSRIFSIACEATLQDVADQATKDAYKALKGKLYCCAAFDVDALERNPSSAARRAVIAEAVDHLPEFEQASVETLATELAQALGVSAAQRSRGIDVSRLEAERTKLESFDTRESEAHEVLVR